MEIKIDRHSEVYSWSVTDDYGAVLEYGKESSREAAQRAAEMAAAWIQSKTIATEYGG